MEETAIQLNGAPLQLPNIKTMDWTDGQCFSVEDDPDRMNSHVWAPPAFVSEVDPAVQRLGTVVEELIPCKDGSFASVIHNVLTEPQCAALLGSINTKGFTPALLNIGGGMQELMPSMRDGHRAIVDSPAFTTWLMEVLKPHLPADKLVELNERCRFLCYTPGQEFAVHCDGQYTRPYNHPRAGDHSRITVQMYLHDVPEENGGATTFVPLMSRHFYEAKDGDHNDVKCQPKAGSVLLFTQDLPHEGSVVKMDIKYTMRTEVMYSP